jgi:hypothetical protein
VTTGRRRYAVQFQGDEADWPGIVPVVERVLNELELE